MGEGLIVTFNDTITATSQLGRAWFIVTVEYPLGPNASPQLGMQGTILIQRVLDNSITVENGNEVRFSPDSLFGDTFVSTVRAAGLGESLCRIVLKCDFLADDQGRSADGDFLKGGLPSGDGIPGGDFESWFTLRV
jgi:hypothetical protein